jgi:hypothetical protein
MIFVAAIFVVTHSHTTAGFARVMACRVSFLLPVALVVLVLAVAAGAAHRTLPSEENCARSASFFFSPALFFFVGPDAGG